MSGRLLGRLAEDPLADRTWRDYCGRPVSGGKGPAIRQPRLIQCRQGSKRGRPGRGAGRPDDPTLSRKGPSAMACLEDLLAVARVTWVVAVHGRSADNNAHARG